jgi:hypothetical protein
MPSPSRELGGSRNILSDTTWAIGTSISASVRTGAASLKEDHRERQAKQEAHLRRANRAERADQIALHRVAQRLRARRQKRDRNPNPVDGHCQSPLVLVSRSTASSNSDAPELRGPRIVVRTISMELEA